MKKTKLIKKLVKLHKKLEEADLSWHNMDGIIQSLRAQLKEEQYNRSNAEAVIASLADDLSKVKQIIEDQKKIIVTDRDKAGKVSTQFDEVISKYNTSQIGLMMSRSIITEQKKIIDAYEKVTDNKFIEKVNKELDHGKEKTDTETN